jgi:ATP-dependent Lon protease
MIANGLKESEVEISEEVVRYIVQHYTREAGVRNLEREISKIFRKVVKEILLEHNQKKKPEKKVITIASLENYLGVMRYRHDMAEEKDQIGQVKGLAWTEVGGELLNIEAMTVPGKGKITNTGQLGEVMQESIQAALTVVRSRAPLLGIPKNFFDKHDIHVHVPEGATPKDGPSAGVGMCTALVSILTHIPVRADYAMTGEITLRGEVLPVGGLKEKLLAAHRGGIKSVIIPAENVKDLKEIPDNIKKDLAIKPVRWIDEVLSYALNGYAARLPAKGRSKRAKAVILTSNKKVRKGERIRAH